MVETKNNLEVKICCKVIAEPVDGATSENNLTNVNMDNILFQDGVYLIPTTEKSKTLPTNDFITDGCFVLNVNTNLPGYYQTSFVFSHSFIQSNKWLFLSYQEHGLYELVSAVEKSYHLELYLKSCFLKILGDPYVILSLQRSFWTTWLSNVSHEVLKLLFDKYVQLKQHILDTEDEQNIRSLEIYIAGRMGFTMMTVEQMATKVNMSISKFKSIFRMIYGKSPHQHFLDKKFQIAVDLLLADNYLSISQISYKVGFSHPSGLTRLLKSKLGVKPSDFKTKN